MLSYQGKQVNQLAIWFRDGLALSANPNPFELLLERESKPISFEWFDVLIFIADHEPARLWKADIEIGAAFDDKYLYRMVADFWCGKTTNKRYWKSWWVQSAAGDRYNHEFTCHHQSDAADNFNRSHPGVQIASVAGKDRVYLNAITRSIVDSDPVQANQPVSSLLQFENVC
jgi:hypothetical protein